MASSRLSLSLGFVLVAVGCASANARDALDEGSNPGTAGSGGASAGASGVAGISGGGSAGVAGSKSGGGGVNAAAGSSGKGGSGGTVNPFGGGGSPNPFGGSGGSATAICGDPCVTSTKPYDPTCDLCVSDVCDISPSCCTSKWSLSCVFYAEDLCGATCNTGSAGSSGSAGSGGKVAVCDDPCVSHSGTPMKADCDACTAEVCADDPFCCKTAWDSFCASSANSVCSTCGGSGGSGGSAGSTSGPICADACLPHPEALKTSCSSCTGTVCGIDDYCCTVSWDGYCAARAQKSCSSGCGAAGSGGAAGTGGASGASGTAGAGGDAGASGAGAGGAGGDAGAGGAGGDAGSSGAGGDAGASGATAGGAAGAAGASGEAGTAGTSGASGAGGSAEVPYSVFALGFGACLDFDKFKTTSSLCTACVDVSCDQEWFTDGGRECSVANSSACDAKCTSADCFCHCMIASAGCAEKLKSYYSCMTKACGADCK